MNPIYTGYMTNEMQAGEFVQALIVPLNGPARELRVYKISKRFDCDISALCAGLAIELEDNTVSTVRLAYGGMAATVKRAAQAEAALVGQPWTQATVRAAQVALAQDFAPLSDMRASAAYRLQVAQNLLQRFWLETRAENPLPAAATSVFSVLPHDGHTTSSSTDSTTTSMALWQCGQFNRAEKRDIRRGPERAVALAVILRRSSLNFGKRCLYSVKASFGSVRFRI